MTRKPDDWMPLVIGKYLANTTHLTRDQHGAYLLLLMAYWTNGGPIDADDMQLAATARATPAEWRRMRPVIAKFFTEAGGKWHQKKADEELARAKRLTDAKADAGAKGAAKRWHSDSTANGTAMAKPSYSQCQTDAPLPLPVPVSKEEKVSPAGAGLKTYSAQFEEFWKAYPTDKNMSKKAAFKQWQRLGAEKRQQAIDAIPGFKRYCSANHDWYRPVYAERFLSQEKFEGYLAEKRPANDSPFNSPEEIEAQRKIREAAYGQAAN